MIIKSRRRVLELLRQGVKRNGQLLTLYLTKRAKGQARFSFLVDRDIREATERNRLKRITREIVRVNKGLLNHCETIILVKEAAVAKTFWQVREDFLGLATGKVTRNQ